MTNEARGAGANRHKVAADVKDIGWPTFFVELDA
jgi:hypothetical protein